MPARDLTMIKTRTQLRAAATNRQRVRVRGVVAQRGGSHYGGGYRNVWLRVETAVGNVRVTASPGTPLGTMPEGSRIELAVTPRRCAVGVVPSRRGGTAGSPTRRPAPPG